MLSVAKAMLFSQINMWCQSLENVLSASHMKKALKPHNYHIFIHHKRQNKHKYKVKEKQNDNNG